MADARKCDRCGKFYEQYNMTTGNFNAIRRCRCLSDGRGSGEERAVIELCPECYKDFEVFMHPNTTKEIRDMVDRFQIVARHYILKEEETKNGM